MRKSVSTALIHQDCPIMVHNCKGTIHICNGVQCQMWWNLRRPPSQPLSLTSPPGPGCIDCAGEFCETLTSGLTADHLTDDPLFVTLVGERRPRRTTMMLNPMAVQLPSCHAQSWIQADDPQIGLQLSRCHA